MEQAANRDLIDAIKRGWNDDAFMRAQGLHVEERAFGEVTLCLPQAGAAQRGGGAGGDATKVLNGGVIAYMCDGALGYSIISGLLALPEAARVDVRALRIFTITLTMTYLDVARGDRFEARGRVLRLGRGTAFAEGQFTDSEGKVCATAQGIWRVLWPAAERCVPA
ncbi:MAG: PaaI family thioesterase [Burkholderiaceae bacterium]|nr:PaaI family thioesterase [Burkholderiaceae bacterium]